MAPRFGDVLYWIGCGIAVLGIGLALLLVVAIDPASATAFEGYCFAATLAIIGGASWALGRTFRSRRF